MTCPHSLNARDPSRCSQCLGARVTRVAAGAAIIVDDDGGPDLAAMVEPDADEKREQRRRTLRGVQTIKRQRAQMQPSSDEIAKVRRMRESGENWSAVGAALGLGRESARLRHASIDMQIACARRMKRGTAKQRETL